MIRAIAALLLAAFSALAASPAPPAASPAGKFDYYILALSWSPTYCASPGAARREPLQCRARRGFIVHGLWPEYEHGFPQNCPSALAREVATDVQRRQFDLTPSPSLLAHEWRSHGLCTGLTQSVYFDTARTLRAKVRLPAAYAAPAQQFTTTAQALRTAFVQTNTGLPRDGLVIVCDKNRLASVRICFSKTGAFRRCSETRDSCPAGAIMAPASKLQ